MPRPRTQCRPCHSRLVRPSRSSRIVAVVATAVILLVTGSAVTILNLGLLGLVALSTLGLAGAAYFSPHRGRAIFAGVAIVLIVLGTLWVLNVAFIGVGAALV